MNSKAQGRGNAIPEIARGIYQCVKYRAVLEAQSSVSRTPFDVAVMLVIGGELPLELLELANAFGVSVKDRVVHDL